TVLEAGHSQESAGRPGRRVEDRYGVEPGPRELVELVVDDPVAEHSPGGGPRQQLHPGVVRVAGALVPPGAQPAHVRRVTGELRLALARVALELADVDQRGDDRDPGLRGAGDRLVREAGGMLEAVESGVQSERDRG